MPQHKAQVKSLKQNKKKNARNVANKSALRTAIKKVNAAIESKDIEGAKKLYVVAQQLLDKACKRSIIKANKASRSKSSLMKKINGIQTA